MRKKRVEIANADRQLFEQHYESLRRFAAVTAPTDLEPDDLLQDALLRVLSHGPLSDRDHPVAYLRRTIVNLAIDHGRRRDTRRAAMSRYVSSRAVVDLYPSDLDILQELSPRARAVVYLSEIDGYRYGEIAKMLDCTEVAARMAGMRARRQLRGILGKEAAHG